MKMLICMGLLFALSLPNGKLAFISQKEENRV